MPIQTAIDSISNSQGSPFGFKNRIINGAMVIDQRNAGAEVSPAGNNTYCIDRWMTNSNVSSKFKIQQNAGSVTPPTGFTYYLGATSLSAYTVGSTDSFGLVQKIEGYNFADLDFGKSTAKTVTISFWVRSSLTGTFGGSLTNGDINRSYPFTYTINAANTWEKETITIPGDTTGSWLTTNGIAAWVWFGLGMGSTLSGTAGAWAGAEYRSATGGTSVVGTNGATFYITGVQVEKGTQATEFDYRPYGMELALCQRYFQLSARGLGVWTAANALRTISSFQTTMRAAPTVAIFTPGAYVEYWNATGYNLGGSANIGFSTTSINGWDARIDSAIASSPGRTYVDPAMVDFNTFSFSSEL
jgi:hypothetical protein